MEQILSYIENYGLPVFLIATCIILFIGVLKLCKVFDKIKNKNIKKLIYYVLDIALSFAGAAIYYTIFELAWDSYLVYSLKQIIATTTLYAVYENFHIRTLVQIILNCIASWFKANPEHKLTKFAKEMGYEHAIELIKNAQTAATQVTTTNPENKN